MRRVVMERSMSASGEAVAHAEDRLDVAGVGWIGFDLGAQIADVLIDGAGDTLERGAFELAQQIHARVDAVRARP